MKYDEIESAKNWREVLKDTAADKEGQVSIFQLAGVMLCGIIFFALLFVACAAE